MLGFRGLARWVVAAGSAALAVVLLAGVPAGAGPSDDQARTDRELAQARTALEAASERVEAAAAAFEEANRRLPAARAKVSAARAAVAGARAEAMTAALAATRAGEELAAADTAARLALRRVDDAAAEVQRYAVSAYQGGDIGGMDALLGLTNPADFIAGYEYLDRVAAAQRQALNRLTGAQVAAEAQRAVQADKASQAEQARQAADRSLRRSLDAAAAADAAGRELAALVAQREQALAVAEEERADSLKRYEEFKAESARIAAEVRSLAAGGGTALTPGVRLPMPVDGWKTSNFGMRYDPFYHIWQLHAGVDLAATGGSPIWAVAAGKVFRAGWSGGYGNYTCLYHGRYEGKGFATCYAHQSAILVKVGQQVRQGQVIGRVGTTGASTGNHLHFEIRFDGEPVDPVPWLPKCLC